MPTTGFTVNTHRYDPYKNYNFRLVWNNRTVLGVSKVSALKRSTEVVRHRSGGQDSFEYKSKGKTTTEAIQIERGITHDLEFHTWAEMIGSYAGDTTINLVEYKRPLTLEFLNERQQVVHRYFLHEAWVSEYQATPDFDANGTPVVAIEHLKIEIQGWTRDPDTREHPWISIFR